MKKGKKSRKVENNLLTILALISGTVIGLTIVNPSVFAIFASIITFGSTISTFSIIKMLDKAEKKLEMKMQKIKQQEELLEKKFEKNSKKIEKDIESARKSALNELSEPVELIDLKNTLIAYNELYENNDAFDEKMSSNELDETVIEDYVFTVSNLLGEDAKIIFTKAAIVDLICKLRNINVKEISPAFVFYNNEFYVYKHINKEVSILAPIKDEIMYKIFDSNKKNYDRPILCDLFTEKFGDLDGNNFQK